MANLIDKLTGKVDRVRQKAADKFGLPRFNMYRILRTWSGGEVGAGTPTSIVTLITPTPKIELKGDYKLLGPGIEEDRTMKASEISLTFTEDFLIGAPKTVDKECFYKLVERNGQNAATTYWILKTVPQAQRDEINWVLEFNHYHTKE